MSTAQTAESIVYRTSRASYLIDLDDSSVRVWDDIARHYTLTIDVSPTTKRKALAAARRLAAGKCDESHDLHWHG